MREGPPEVDPRYSRQALFARLGSRGQARIASARIGVVGCGALGSVVANHLVRAGTGLVRIIDRDFVELVNLQRQILFDEEDVARCLPKAVAAAEHLRAVNSDVAVEPVVGELTPHSIHDFAAGLDLLVDGTDNFAARYLVNDYSVRFGIPWVYGGVIGASGLIMTIVPGEGPCLRCVFPEPPPPGSAPTCDTAGVMNTAAAVVASLEANEAFKLLVDPEARSTGLFSLDLWDMSFESVPVEVDPDCPACGRRSFPYLEAEEEGTSVVLCGRDAVQVSPSRMTALDLEALGRRLESVGEVRLNPFLLVFEAEGKTLTIFPDGRAIVAGTTDLSVAGTLYSRYIGY